MNENPQARKEGNKILIRGIINGTPVSLASLGLNQQTPIKRLWTILDEEKLFNGFDMETGRPVSLTLADVKPKHFQNAFIEDRMHDWWIVNGELRFESHTTEVGEKVDILIELE